MSYFSMSKMALKWAFKKPITKNYPFGPRIVIPKCRGELDVTLVQCTYCTLCAKRCPTGAIAVSRSPKTWTIDRLLCIQCGYCVELCPKKCLSLSTSHGTTAITKDREHFFQPTPPPAPAAPVAAAATATVATAAKVAAPVPAPSATAPAVDTKPKA